jgi:hypothetical protein
MTPVFMRPHKDVLDFVHHPVHHSGVVSRSHLMVKPHHPHPSIASASGFNSVPSNPQAVRAWS